MAAEELDISKSLEQSLRDSRRIQEDTNSELNKSINLLSQINDLRDQSISRVRALNKETVNTRDIQKELKKATEKDELARLKVAKLESSLSETEKRRANRYLIAVKGRENLEEKITRAKLKGDTDLVASLGERLTFADRLIEESEKGLNIDERRYAAAVEANKVSSETKNLLQGELDIEKEIQESVGVTGVALGKFSEKLGLGTKYSAELVKKARELEEEGKKLTFGDKLSVLYKTGKGAIQETFTDPLTAIPAVIGIVVAAYKGLKAGLDMVGSAAAKAGNFMAGMSEDSSNIVRGLTSGISDLVRKIPLVGGLLGGLIDGFSAILDLVIGVDNYIVKTGRQLNMTAAEARAFNRSLQDASFNSNNIYINSKKLLQSQADLTDQLGTVNILNQEILETNVALKDFAGLEADTRARIAELAITTEQTSQGTVKGILAQVEGLRKATGIEFQSQKILKEVASQSGFIALQFSRYPKEMAKALITVKSMGLELKQLYSIGDSFLDFESSISKEFEAQLLTGKDINLAKAREAFLNNDLVTAAEEITRQVGTTADFEKMRRIQQESLAQAMGMSVDQLSEMLRQQEILARVGGKQGDNATEQLRLAREKYKTEEKVKEALGEQNYQALTNMSVQEKIASFIEKIKQSIVDFVERTNIIEKIENFIEKLSNPETIQGILGKIRDTISSFIKVAGELLADIIEVGGEIADTLTPFSKTDYSDRADAFAEQIRAGYRKMSKAVDSVGGGITIKDNVAKDKVNSSSSNNSANNNNNNQNNSKADNMSMAPKILKVSTTVKDHKKDAEQRMGQAPNQDGSKVQ